MQGYCTNTQNTREAWVTTQFVTLPLGSDGCLKKKGKWTKWVYPPLFHTKVRGGKMQTSSPPVITPNRSQSNPDDMITLPRPIQSVGMDLHDVSGTSTGQTLPRERRAPPGTHFCPTIWWVYPHSATIFILHPLLSNFSSTFDHSSTSKGGLKRQSLLQTWCGSAPRRGPSANGYDAWRFGSCGPGCKILAAAAADMVWVCAPPRTIRKWLRRLAFGSCGPGRKILAAAAADLVWVCAPPRTIRKWLQRLALWILRTRAQDPCSCCCRPGVGLRPAADHPQMVTTPGVLDPADPRARSLQLLLDISDKSGRKSGQ